MKNILILCTLILFIFSCAKKQVERKRMYVPEPDISDITFKSDKDKGGAAKEVPEIVINKTPAEAFKSTSKEVVKNTPKEAFKNTPKVVVKNTPKVVVENTSKVVIKNTPKKKYTKKMKLSSV